mmetsp:Transcript_14822/g.42037  ORF Transcript_14822/g.42037 Transcript_14822/m.42037 type:complete len:681 (-) Transcript_14822:178-2220(-)
MRRGSGAGGRLEPEESFRAIDEADDASDSEAVGVPVQGRNEKWRQMEVTNSDAMHRTGRSTWRSSSVLKLVVVLALVGIALYGWQTSPVRASAKNLLGKSSSNAQPTAPQTFAPVPHLTPPPQTSAQGTPDLDETQEETGETQEKAGEAEEQKDGGVDSPATSQTAGDEVNNFPETTTVLDKAVNTPWPLPAEFTSGSEKLCLHAGRWAFRHEGPCAGAHATSDGCEILNKAFKRYTRHMFQGRTPPTGPDCYSSASVQVSNSSAYLDFGVDESYELEVSSGQIKVKANTVFGAMYGLESLSQLVRYDALTDSFWILNAPWVIKDKPRFQYRELLVDSSRHFQPIASLEAIIASLPAAKINTLHWHLEDDQSWPVCFKFRRELCERSAYSPDQRYSVSDVRHLVNYAREHGVRVVPEIDLPGHTQALCKALPGICTADLKIVSPAGDGIMEALEGIIKEVSELFPDSFIHLGGDEVGTSRWSSDPRTAAWMAEHHTTPTAVYELFVKKAHEFAIKYGKVPVGWSEIWIAFGTKLDKSSVLQKWRSGDRMSSIVSKGYRALWSDVGDWYLDMLQYTWDKVYRAEPCKGLTDDQCSLILGGGGEMWGETVDTSDVLQTVWPRLGAIGERLWSPKGATISSDAARPRMIEFRCLLNRRGVPAAPLLNSKARMPPPRPGSCTEQ